MSATPDGLHVLYGYSSGSNLQVPQLPYISDDEQLMQFLPFYNVPEVNRTGLLCVEKNMCIQ